MKRSLVTGGHGFVASNLARALLERGDAVSVLDLAPTPRSGLVLQGIENEVELLQVDLRDAEGQLRAYRHEGFWDCMDTYKDAVVLNDLWSAGRAPWRIWDAAPVDAL